MMETVTRSLDILAAVSFLVALTVLLTTPVQRSGKFVPAVKWSIIAGLAIFVFLTGTDSIGQTHIGEFGGLFEDYVETLETLIALGAVFAMYASQQYDDALRAQTALAQSHGLMMDIVDEAPAGILFLDDAGRIAFANATAKTVLDLSEDPDTGSITGPGWVADGQDEAAAGALPALVAEEPYEHRSVTLRWPNGWFVKLRASGRPLSDSKERLGGVVVTFEQA
jgi:PAS domain-containing protein